jgi:hypothetical protein
VTKCVEGCSGLERDFKYCRVQKVRIERYERPKGVKMTFDEINRPRYTATLIAESPEITERFTQMAKAPKSFPPCMLLMQTVSSFGLFNAKSMVYEVLIKFPFDLKVDKDCSSHLNLIVIEQFPFPKIMIPIRHKSKNPHYLEF